MCKPLLEVNMLPILGRNKVSGDPLFTTRSSYMPPKIKVSKTKDASEAVTDKQLA